jgi:hypothetical protein
MFGSLSRSWNFAMTSYRILGRHKRLIVFPLLATIAAALVLASFLAPLWFTGQLERWANAAQGPEGLRHNVGVYVTLFLFYFCNYFVIVFFNSALIACVMQVLRGEEPTIDYGLWMAGKRLPQILGWALVSAFVGVVLRIIENSNKRVGELIAGVLGMAWTAMTYFVVPVIVLEGVGPIEAVKRSLQTLKATWGKALVGNFSLGLVGLLVLLPIYLVGIGLIVLGIMSVQPWVLVPTIAVAVLLFVLASAISSAAGTVFMALLFSYATGQTLPTTIDESRFAEAFIAKK